MTSGFSNPSFPLKNIFFEDMRTPEKNKKTPGRPLGNMNFVNPKISKIENFEFVDQIWKRRAAKNDEDPFNKSSKS